MAHQVVSAELSQFELMVALDRRHQQTLRSLGADPARLALLRAFDPAAGAAADVPDPYYGDDAVFDDCRDMIAAGCRASSPPWRPTGTPSGRPRPSAGGPTAPAGPPALRRQHASRANPLVSKPPPGAAGRVCAIVPTWSHEGSCAGAASSPWAGRSPAPADLLRVLLGGVRARRPAPDDRITPRPPPSTSRSTRRSTRTGPATARPSPLASAATCTSPAPSAEPCLRTRRPPSARPSPSSSPGPS